MEDWQRRFIRGIVDEIDAHLSGEQSLRRTLTNVRGLFDAADVKNRSDRDAFEWLWYQVDLEDEAREPEFPPGTFSEERLHAAWIDLRTWAVDTGNVGSN